MDAVSITVGLSWTLGGLLIMGVALPLARGRVPWNPLYGVRLPQSFRSDEAWFAINRFGGKRLVVWSIPMVATGLVSFFIPMQPYPTRALIISLAPLVFLFIPVVESWRFAKGLENKP